MLDKKWISLFVNGTWSTTMMSKITSMIRECGMTRVNECRIKILKDHGFDIQKGGSPMIITNLFQQCQEFTVGLVEGLFTLDDFTNDISVVYYREFLKSKYGLQLLREKHIDLNILRSDFKDIYRVREFFNHDKVLKRFRKGIFWVEV